MLTKEMIMKRCRNNISLKEIKKLNIYGEDVEDISILSQMTDLEILLLSSNKISSLSSLKNCTKIKELYLRNNYIDSFNEIKYLKNLEDLKILWLEGNPICRDPLYRTKILEILPSIVVLDNKCKYSKSGMIQKQQQSFNKNIEIKRGYSNKDKEKKLKLRRVDSFLENNNNSNEEVNCNKNNSEIRNNIKNFIEFEENNFTKNIPLDLNEFQLPGKINENHKKIFRKLKLKLRNNEQKNPNRNFFRKLTLEAHYKDNIKGENNKTEIQQINSSNFIRNKFDKKFKPISINCFNNSGNNSYSKDKESNSINIEDKKILKYSLNKKKNNGIQLYCPDTNDVENEKDYILDAIYILVNKMSLKDLITTKKMILGKISQLENK